jgi:hypothetical protein
VIIDLAAVMSSIQAGNKSTRTSKDYAFVAVTVIIAEQAQVALRGDSGCHSPFDCMVGETRRSGGAEQIIYFK